MVLAALNALTKVIDSAKLSTEGTRVTLEAGLVCCLGRNRPAEVHQPANAAATPSADVIGARPMATFAPEPGRGRARIAAKTVRLVCVAD
jgi:hypothetical protein